jgi:hypothetical protein
MSVNPVIIMVLKLSDGNETFINMEDYDAIKDYQWKLDKGYVRAWDDTKQKYVYMHRIIMAQYDNRHWLEVDHINGLRMDNRRDNLRRVTHSQNMMNRGLQINNKSGKTGVYRAGKKWRAEIYVNYVKKHLGCFDTFEEAVAARNRAEEVFFGEYRCQH